MTRLLKISALALALQPLPTLAAPVTLQAIWGCTHSSCAFSSPGVMTFTYDDSTAGVVSNAGGTFPWATYTDAITSATMVFDNLSLTFDAAGGSTIVVRQGRTVGEGYDASISFYMRDAGNTRYRFDTSFEDYSHTNGGMELSWLAGLLADEGFSTLLPDGVPINGSSGAPYWLNQYTPLAEVPVPATAWLFGSAVLSLAGVAKRKKM